MRATAGGGADREQCQPGSRAAGCPGTFRPPPETCGRSDRDYAISWVKTCGKGRIFYCSLSHRNEIFWNPVVLKHFLAGIQWTLGDLDGVETKPNPLP